MGSAGLLGLGKLGYDEYKARYLTRDPEPAPNQHSSTAEHNPTMLNHAKGYLGWAGKQAATAAGAIGGVAQQMGKDFAKYQVPVDSPEVKEVSQPKAAAKPSWSMLSVLKAAIAKKKANPGNNEATSTRRVTPLPTTEEAERASPAATPVTASALNVLMQNRRNQAVGRGVKKPDGLPQPMANPGIRNAKGRMVVTPFETVGKKSAMPGYMWAEPPTAYGVNRIGATVGQDGRSIFRKFRATAQAEPVLQRLNSGLARQHFATNPKKPLPDQFWTPYTGRLNKV